LRTLISSGGDFLQNRIAEPVSKARTDAERKVEHWRSEAQHRVDRVLHRDNETEASAEQEAQAATDGMQDMEDADSSAGINSLVEQTQRAYDDIQHRIDERVRLVVSALTQSSAVEQELMTLRQQVEALQDRVSVLEASNKSE
jgi:vacuolar-type H+-ATPase subunit H